MSVSRTLRTVIFCSCTLQCLLLHSYCSTRWAHRCYGCANGSHPTSTEATITKAATVKQAHTIHEVVNHMRIRPPHKLDMEEDRNKVVTEMDSMKSREGLMEAMVSIGIRCTCRTPT